MAAVRYETVAAAIAELDCPTFTSAAAGRMLYDFVSGSETEDVLELGFAHGISTAYMAAALAEKGSGSVTTIDRRSARGRRPNVEQVLAQLGLESWVRPLFVESSYNWELMRMIESKTVNDDTVPAFDFCFIDGAHTWETDGLAFLLVDKLLRPDRWILFDDLTWTPAARPSSRRDAKPGPSEEERNTAQVAKVFDLLVRQHPRYEAFVVTGNYGWAYKTPLVGELRHRHDVEERIGSQLVRELIDRRRSHPTAPRPPGFPRHSAGMPDR